MALIFIKVAPYGYNTREKGLRYYAGLAAQRISPPLLPNSQDYILKHVKKGDLKDVKLILSSPQKRAIQTAEIIRRQFLKNTLIRVDSDLNEVPFSLEGLDSKTYSSTIARTKFLQDFVNNTLLESTKSIKARIKSIFKKAERADTLLVTHTFLMKILETFVEFPDLFESTQKLRRNFTANRRLFDYCEMLTTENKIKQSLNKEKGGF